MAIDVVDDPKQNVEAKNSTEHPSLPATFNNEPPADRLEAVVDSVADEFANSPRLIVGGGNGDAPNKEQRERCTR
jgi:hypothetical protein